MAMTDDHEVAVLEREAADCCPNCGSDNAETLTLASVIDGFVFVRRAVWCATCQHDTDAPRAAS